MRDHRCLWPRHPPQRLLDNPHQRDLAKEAQAQAGQRDPHLHAETTRSRSSINSWITRARGSPCSTNCRRRERRMATSENSAAAKKALTPTNANTATRRNAIMAAPIGPAWCADSNSLPEVRVAAAKSACGNLQKSISKSVGIF